MPFQPNYDVPEERRPYMMGDGRTGILVLHGFLGSAISSRPLAHYLADNGYRVHCPLLPGHGHYPDKLYKVHRSRWIAEVEEARQTLRQSCDELFIIGHSMGTVLGAHLITQFGNIQGMVMLAPVYDVPDNRLRYMWLIRRVMPWYYPHKSRRESMQQLVRERVLDFDPTLDYDAPATQARLPKLTRVPTSGLDEMTQMVAYGRSLWPQLTLPIRVFQGGHDRAVAAENTQILYDILPSQDKKLHFFPEAGHELMRPFDPTHEEVWPTILEFIQSHSTLI
jgi:carboxylesterase